jgi:hypothetical protein|tara:strand:- start:310 stop:510 length:201 start_codon:yes stop_codon:yes gene_type:complete
MKIDGVTYEIDWTEFRIGSSFFIPCVGVTTGKQLIERKMARLGFGVVVKIVIEDGVKGLRVWRKKK